MGVRGQHRWDLGRRRSFVLTLLVALLVGIAPSSSGAADLAATRTSDAFDGERRTRALLATGRLTDAIDAVVGLGPAIGDGPATRARPKAPASVPPRLRAAVGALLGSVEAASASARASMRDRLEMPAVLRALREAAAGLRGPGRLPSLLRADRVDRAALGRAMAIVAGAVDTALPVLERYARSRPASAERVGGCDIVDAAPALCVGGEGSNVYREESALAIDLGGNDTYLNSAAGAQPGVDLIPVKVSIDVAGNDRYLTPSSDRSSIQAAQGSGILGGVGVLVDASGNDRYRRNDFAQAYGLLGAGVLADLDGDDRYELDSRLGKDSWATGQGLGGGPGYALFFEGGGDDVYSAKSFAVPDPKKRGSVGSSITWAHGWSLGGTALVWDAGGRDRASVAAYSVAREETEGTDAMGFGTAGYHGTVAVVLSGTGNTTRRLVSEQHGRNTPWWTGITPGFGAAVSATAGVVSDAGGNDTYEVRAINEARERSGGIWAWTMGFGLAAAGVLHDVSGDDRYRLIAVARGASSSGTSSVDVMGLAAGPGGSIADDGGNDVYESYVSNRVPGLYFNGNVEAAGGGTLRDVGGADRYAATARTGNVEIAEGFGPSWHAQGANLGTLVDVDDGARDRFRQDPERPVCSGERGRGAWMDCGGGAGVTIP